jgi:hypothetical protein
VKFGPTGDYPRGKLNESDEGGLAIGTNEVRVPRIPYPEPSSPGRQTITTLSQFLCSPSYSRMT